MHCGRDRQSTWVDVLRSVNDPEYYYTGLTANLNARLAAHNAGRCRHTTRFRPWRLDLAIGFGDANRAAKFEKYLKSASGVASARRHFR